MALRQTWNLQPNMSDQRTVLVTGGARGIGRSIAELYRMHGYAVATPGRAELDLASNESIQRFVAAGGTAVDVLVNNAGENKIGPLETLDPDDWDRILQTNLTAPMLLIRAAAQHMAAKGWGRVVNISSCYSMVSRAGRGPYTASKSGLNGLTRTAALEYAARGVLINALCPGFVETDMTRANNSPEQIAALCALVPLGRLAKPDEIARGVYFLGSEENTYMTGQAIVLDGGFLIR